LGNDIARVGEVPKREEMRIGNYIFANGVLDQVSDIFNGDVLTKKAGKPRVELIPLSDEWFNRFNFKKDGEYWCISDADINYCFKYADFRDDWGFYIEYTDSPFDEDEGKYYPVSFGTKYVNQLQNLIHSLTGGELTLSEI
jgi:hypothetical protein